MLIEAKKFVSFSRFRINPIRKFFNPLKSFLTRIKLLSIPFNPLQYLSFLFNSFQSFSLLHLGLSIAMKKRPVVDLRQTDWQVVSNCRIGRQLIGKSLPWMVAPWKNNKRELKPTCLPSSCHSVKSTRAN